MANLAAIIPMEAFLTTIKEELEEQLKKIALKEADRLAAEYSDFLRRNFASIATSAAITLANRVSVFSHGSELRIELAVKDARSND